MFEPAQLAGRLLKLEQQLQAYEKLHREELAELWQALNECKREIASALADDHASGSTASQSDNGKP